MKNTYMAAAWALLIASGISTGFAIALNERTGPAERVKSGYVACISAYALEQYEQAPHRRQIGLMMQDECLPTDRIADYDFEALGIGKTSKVRLFLENDQYADVYLPVEAIQPENNRK